MQSPHIPITVLFVDHAPAIGGAEHSLLLILKNLNNSCWQPHLACVEGTLAKAGYNLNISVHEIMLPRLRQSPTTISGWWRAVSQLAQMTRDIDAAILIANTVRAALYAALAARIARRPFIWHMRDFWLSEAKPQRIWIDTLGKRALSSAATHIIANSHSVAAHLPTPAKVTVIHNGIDPERFEPTLDSTPFRTQYEIPQNAKVIGMVGRLRPWKGQERFLHMAAQILMAKPDTYFIVVGGDPFSVNDGYGQQLQTLLEDLALTDRVLFTGHLEDVRPALAAMDIFVHPGDPEPFGLVITEAMAMAKPVIAFAHGASPEIILDGVTGLMVSANDKAALAKAAIGLLENEHLVATFGQAGRQRIEDHFHIATTTKRIEDVFKQTLSSK